MARYWGTTAAGLEDAVVEEVVSPHIRSSLAFSHSIPHNASLFFFAVMYAVMFASIHREDKGEFMVSTDLPVQIHYIF